MRRLIPFFASHAPIAAGYLLSRYLPFSPLSVLLLPLLVMIYPGTILLKPTDRWGWAYWVRVVAASNGILVGAIVVARIIGFHLFSYHAWALLCLVLWSGWILSPHHVGSLLPRLIKGVMGIQSWKKILLTVGFASTYAASMWVVPPQQDQDMVIANPTHGYIQFGKPYGTETHFAYIFSKPPLLHLQAGFTMLLLDELETAYFYWQSGRIVELLGEPPWATRKYRRRDIECFDLNQDMVRATRIISVFYATVLPLLLAELALCLGASRRVAFSAGLVYTAIPEVFIRAGYAGFTTPSNVLLSVAAILLLRGRSLPRLELFLLGLLMATTNQKTLFVPAAYALWFLVRTGIKGPAKIVRDTWLWGIGFGTALWWSYGAAVDWSTFLQDHFYYDFRDRFLIQELPLGLSGSTWYPGIGGLWLEWARNLTPVLLLLGVFGVLWGLIRSERGRFLSIWALIGWVLASTTDWRQTKHLMLTLVPMTALAALFVSGLGRRSKRAVGLVCFLALCYNLLRIVQLWFDFNSLTPSTVW